MIQPQPFKYQCPKCGYTKVVRLKSDVVDPREMFNICSKCNSSMKKVDLNIIDKLFR